MKSGFKSEGAKIQVGKDELEVRVLQETISGKFVLEVRANTGYLKIQPHTSNRVTIEVTP